MAGIAFALSVVLVLFMRLNARKTLKPPGGGLCKQQNRLAAPKSDFLSTCPDIEPPQRHNGDVPSRYAGLQRPAGYLCKIDQSSHQLIFAYQRYFGYVRIRQGKVEVHVAPLDIRAIFGGVSPTSRRWPEKKILRSG